MNLFRTVIGHRHKPTGMMMGRGVLHMFRINNGAVGVVEIDPNGGSAEQRAD